MIRSKNVSVERQRATAIAVRTRISRPSARWELCWNLGDAVIRRRSVLAC